jgi:uncharacterized protein
MRLLALSAIDAYQKYISPRKGFHCAYRVHTGHRGCSALGYRAIRRYGVFTGLRILGGRFERCSEAKTRLLEEASPLNRQRGVCDCVAIDVPCSAPCELPHLECPSGSSQLCSCCDIPTCDCGKWNQRGSTRGKEKYVYIPPRRWEGSESSRSEKP